MRYHKNQLDFKTSRSLLTGKNDLFAQRLCFCCLQDNRCILSDEEFKIAELLVSIKQEHLFENWGSPGTRDEDKHNLCKQALKLRS